MYNSYSFPGEMQASFKSWNEREIKMVKEMTLSIVQSNFNNVRINFYVVHLNIAYLHNFLLFYY